MVSTSYPLEVKISPPRCGNCAKLRTELEAKDKRIAGYEQNSIKQSEYCEFLEAKWAESKERFAELEETERLLTSALDSIAELLEV